MMAGDLGPTLRAFRQQRGLPVTELARRAGLSRAFVNQIEAGTANPSLKSLQSLAAALDVSTAELMDGDPRAPGDPGTAEAAVPTRPASRLPLPEIVRRDQRKALTYPGAQGRVELLTPDLRRTLEVTLDADVPGQALPPAHTHDGDSFFFALEGTYEAWIDGVRHVLEEGDSIYFSSMLPHAVRLIGDRPGRAFWFSSPPYF